MFFWKGKCDLEITKWNSTRAFRCRAYNPSCNNEKACNSTQTEETCAVIAKGNHRPHSKHCYNLVEFLQPESVKIHRQGCFSSLDEQCANATCRWQTTSHHGFYFCCCRGDFCNAHIKFPLSVQNDLIASSNSNNSDDNDLYIIIGVSVEVVILSVSVFAFGLWLWIRIRRSRNDLRRFTGTIEIRNNLANNNPSNV